jgi:Bacterial extracellular solute-binding proteins, family 5 Middle
LWRSAPTHDAVVFREQTPLAKTVARVEAGEDDYVAERGAALKADGPVARRFGRGSIGGRRYLRSPLLGTDELVFSTARGPLQNTRVRRAINYALDRPAIAAALEDSVTDRYLPVAIPGSHSGHVYPVAGPNLRRARALMRCRRMSVTLAVCSEPNCSRVGRLVAEDLQRISPDNPPRTSVAADQAGQAASGAAPATTRRGTGNADEPGVLLRSSGVQDAVRAVVRRRLGQPLPRPTLTGAPSVGGQYRARCWCGQLPRAAVSNRPWASRDRRAPRHRGLTQR